jgi:hypothetical protein
MARLKIKHAHYAHLKAMVESLTDSEINHGKRTAISNEDLRWGLVERRVSKQWVDDNLRVYLTDNNIDTALKKIMRTAAIHIDEGEFA